MHPAFSVIFFTTASGAGFGLFAWLGLLIAAGSMPRIPTGIALATGAVFAVAGLFSSIAHLGQPTRSWRAFSQWRSSWLSREGVLALACLFTALWVGCLVWFAPTDVLGFFEPATTLRVAAALLSVLSLATIACTAMIYASLKPVPAWRHPLVVPVYMAFAAFTGILLFATTLALSGVRQDGGLAVFILPGAALVLLLKLGAWRYIDKPAAAISRNSALGLPHDRPVQVFERPHTEANYLLKEMGYVLARKHAKRLRLIAAALFSAVPALLALILCLLEQGTIFGVVLPALALASALAGTLVERWLFFAEAKHLVTLYY